MRAVVLIVMGVGALALTLTTTQGQAFLKLLKEAQIEARRVVWPTKDETLQTTMIVFAVVVVMSLVLWGCLLYTSPSPRDRTRSRMPSSA